MGMMMINRPRVENMAGLRRKIRTGPSSTGTSNAVKRCAYAACGRKFAGEGKQMYCSYGCWLASKRVTTLDDAPEWRCGRFAELDRLIELEDRNV